jgi:hypothetical protein
MWGKGGRDCSTPDHKLKLGYGPASDGLVLTLEELLRRLGLFFGCRSHHDGRRRHRSLGD